MWHIMYVTPPGSFLLPLAYLLSPVSLWTPNSPATTTRSSLRIQSDYRSVLSLPDPEITQALKYEPEWYNPAPHTQPRCPSTTAQAARQSPRGAKSCSTPAALHGCADWCHRSPLGHQGCDNAALARAGRLQWLWLLQIKRHRRRGSRTSIRILVRLFLHRQQLRNILQRKFLLVCPPKT